MRLFIAVPLPPEIADRAAACLDPALPALRPVRPELLHITLAFLGQVADERLADASAAAAIAGAGKSPFRIILDRAGRFPASGPPRALWLGVGAGADDLARLAADLARELRARAFALEDRPFRPHLTLARVRTEATPAEARAVAAAVGALAVPRLELRVDQVAVVESHLSPRGPRYTVRAAIRLDGQQP